MGNIMRIKNIIVLFFFLACANAFAVGDHERQELSRLLNELDHLNNIIIVAKNSVEEGRNNHFDYVALEQDIYLIKKGITEYINGERRKPRSLDAITGNFTHGG